MRERNQPRSIAALACSVAFAGFVGIALVPARGHREPPAAPAPAEGLSYRSPLLPGLSVGDDLGPWRVVAIRPPDAQGLAVELGAQGALFKVWVAPRGSQPFNPPLSTERYDLFYSHPHPREAPGAALSLDEPMQQIHARVQRHEALAVGL